MRSEGFQASTKKPKVMVGAALALARTVYGVLAKRRARAQGLAEQRSPAGPSTRRNWPKLLLRVARDVSQKNLTFISAGAAFNALLAVPATLAVLASLALLIFDPLDVQRSVRPVEHLAPSYVITLLSAPHSRQTLGMGLLVSIAIDLWSVRRGSSCMLTALSLVYGEKG